jgi:double-stranded uracil-DNA glycosylase
MEIVLVRGFEAIETKDAKVLILGTIPGQESLRVMQYYADKKNSFWFIMGRLFGANPNSSYGERVEILRKSGLALWDALASAERIGSKDNKIVPGSEIPNDFCRFFEQHTVVLCVFFNGRYAEKLFRKLVLPNLPGQTCSFLKLRRLPSTSGTNTHLTKEEKFEKWKVVECSL